MAWREMIELKDPTTGIRIQIYENESSNLLSFDLTIPGNLAADNSEEIRTEIHINEQQFLDEMGYRIDLGDESE